jgi:hypothetical protein
LPKRFRRLTGLQLRQCASPAIGAHRFWRSLG